MIVEKILALSKPKNHVPILPQMGDFDLANSQIVILRLTFSLRFSALVVDEANQSVF